MQGEDVFLFSTGKLRAVNGKQRLASLYMLKSLIDEYPLNPSREARLDVRLQVFVTLDDLGCVYLLADLAAFHGREGHADKLAALRRDLNWREFSCAAASPPGLQCRYRQDSGKQEMQICSLHFNLPMICSSLATAISWSARSR